MKFSFILNDVPSGLSLSLSLYFISHTYTHTLSFYLSLFCLFPPPLSLSDKHTLLSLSLYFLHTVLLLKYTFSMFKSIEAPKKKRNKDS